MLGSVVDVFLPNGYPTTGTNTGMRLVLEGTISNANRLEPLIQFVQYGI
jgi:hypothetical protein